MRKQKVLLSIIIVMAVVLTILSITHSIKNKPASKIVVPAPAVAVTSNTSFKIRPLTDIHYEPSPSRLKQGEYLTKGILQCFTCHSPRDWAVPGAPPVADKLGSGGTIVNEDNTSQVIAPNITSDNETGAGNWTDDMFVRAIREGVGHDGRALSWQMPFYFFRNLTDEDLASVIVYLRSLPAVKNVVPPTKLTKDQRAEMEKLIGSLRQPTSRAAFSDPTKRGKYLVTLGECVACHTSHAEYNNPGLFGGGNFIERFGRKTFSANITTNPAGMDYGPVGFISVMHTGKGGTLSPIMPWIAFKNISDDDLKAIYNYIATMPPSTHYVSNQQPFTHCAICEMENGLGEKNRREILTGIKLNPDLYDQYAGTYWNEEEQASYIIQRDKNKLVGMPRENVPKTELIPQSELHFSAPGWALAISFVKGKNGRVTGLVEDTDFGRSFKKIK
jgi:mono/diheme cytochrome c family protein